MVQDDMPIMQFVVNKHENNLNVVEGKTINNGKESQYELPDENREQSENRASNSHYESVDKHENNLNAVEGKTIDNGKEVSI